MGKRNNSNGEWAMALPDINTKKIHIWGSNFKSYDVDMETDMNEEQYIEWISSKEFEEAFNNCVIDTVKEQMGVSTDSHESNPSLKELKEKYYSIGEMIKELEELEAVK